MPQSNYSYREASPVFSFAFIFENGPIRMFKWFPLNLRKEKSADQDMLSRIGVLAICFSNGLIGVYSIPAPENFTNADMIIK
jgi:hypothetical protein